MNQTKTKSQTMYIMVKSILDFFGSLFMLVPLTIFSALVKTIYCLYGDFESVFYKQERIGKNGKRFTIIKFRTMSMNAEKELKELLKNHDNYQEWKEFHKLKNDPRITPFGLFLRKSSIDELPQFINVLKGDMSIIGPRPLVPGELEMHGGSKIYESIKPGITGWWACNGRSTISYRERLEYEYYYINNVSLFLDIKILIKTIVCIFRKAGAH